MMKVLVTHTEVNESDLMLLVVLEGSALIREVIFVAIVLALTDLFYVLHLRSIDTIQLSVPIIT